MSTLVGAVILAALAVYALTGGADFGGGVWDLFASGPRKQEQRSLVSKAIAPIWEANHVWLILVIVLGFVCFPPAFRLVMVHLHVPLTLLLVGIVLRGAAFVFRAYDPAGPSELWGRIFAVSSLLTPLMLGVCLGSMLSGFSEDLILGWATPAALWVGLVVTALFAFLAAVYLCVEADGELAEDFRRRALASGIALGVVAIPALSALSEEPVFGEIVAAGPFQLATALMAVAALGALARRRYRLARVFAVTQAAAMVLGFGLAPYPDIVPGLSLEHAAAPDSVLRMTLTVLALGSVLLVPAFVWLYALFKTR